MFEQNIYRMVDQNNGKEIKQVLDTENNKVIWERAIPTYDTPIVPTRNASLLEVSIDGVCTQNGTPTPVESVDIMCNNGAVKWGVIGKNLFNVNGEMATRIKVNLYNTNQLSIGGTNAGVIIPVQPSTQYTIHTTEDVTIFRIATWSTRLTEDDAAVIPHNYVKNTSNTPVTFTTTEDDHYLYIQVNQAKFDTAIAQLQLENGNTATAYEPYIEGIITDGTPEVLTVTASGAATQTASVPDLFAVGDYADEVNIISGGVTHKVGIKVFDGTEAWVAHSVAGIYRYTLAGKKIEKSPFASTRFVYSTKTSSEITNGEMMCGAASTNAYFCNTACATLADFTAWLAEQYAAGTPVIVIYPLKEETIESITPQSLQGYRGKTMIVTAQSQYVSGQNIKVKYLGIDSGTISGDAEIPGGELP